MNDLELAMRRERKHHMSLPREDMTGYIPNNGKISRERYEYALMVMYRLSIGESYASSGKRIKKPEGACYDMVYKVGLMWGTQASALTTVARALRMGYIE